AVTGEERIHLRGAARGRHLRRRWARRNAARAGLHGGGAAVMRVIALGFLAALSLSAIAHAQQARDTVPQELEEIVVVGRVPGPPLWKVTNGEHVLWILPLADFYPRRMEWDSMRVEGLIAGSQEYIA